MPIFVVAVVGSLGFLAITVAIAKGRTGAGGVAVFSFLATVGSLFTSIIILSPFWILQSLLTLLTALACAGFRVKPKATVRACLAATAASFAVALTISFFAYRNYESLRERFPVESMTDRLAYESQAIRANTAVPPVLSSQVEQRLSTTERRRSTSRHFSLRLLHARQTSEFALASGFGIGRMTLPHEEFFAIPAARPIPFPPVPEQPYIPDGTPDKLPGGQVPAALAGQQPLDRPLLAKDDLLSFFLSTRYDFLDPQRIGLVKDRDHVVGFESHRFTQMPQSKADFQLVRLELVSLLKHAVPVAYVSEHLPRMDELKDAPTRPLDNFERHALDQLRSDEDLVIDDTPNRIRMVGSLRAGNDCMECHSVRRGELLGAFSYELAPTRPMPVKRREDKRSEPGA